MNLKYFAYIVIYLSALVVCVVVGALARISFIGKGGDEYTANIVFWSITALSILFYAIIILFLDVIIVGFRKIFRKKNNSTNSTVDFIPTKNHENITIAQRKIIDDNTANQLIEDSKENIEDQTTEKLNLDSLRKNP